MTRICRFGRDQIGILDGSEIVDVTPALDVLPTARWPLPAADLLIANLDRVLERARGLMLSAPRYAVGSVRMLSPVANPPKIIGAPVNYRKHQAEANADGGRNFAVDVKTIDTYGLFLKAGSSLVGTGEGVEIAYPERRTDHEIELVVVIGKGGRNIGVDKAREHIAGYAIGLDMTLRGPEDRSLRKSLDSFTVLGPWLVTADEVADPGRLDMVLRVNGRVRQRTSTAELIFNVDRLIAYASAYYTLCPGDLIYTGTPEGVGPVVPGDVIDCAIDGIDTARVAVFAAAPTADSAALG